jgi:hypothetical protein
VALRPQSKIELSFEQSARLYCTADFRCELQPEILPTMTYVSAFSETDQTDDLKAITVPTLVLQGDDDQVVPYKDVSVLQAKRLKHGTLKIYPGFPHGRMTANADVINANIKGRQPRLPDARPQPVAIYFCAAGSSVFAGRSSMNSQATRTRHQADQAQGFLIA